MQEDTILNKTWVSGVSGEIVAGGPVRKIYSDGSGNWLRCGDRERALLKKAGYLVTQKPYADIILIKYGQPEIEKQCIESIRKYTDLTRHTLTDVDNKAIDKNLGALWNDLISASDAPYVCLLNTDTIVENGWLDNLVEAAETTNADAAGPMTNKCGISYQVGVKKDPPEYREVPQLSGFCVLIRKSSWSKAGGFPEFFPFYGQESDLMDRLKKKIVCKNIFINHLGGGTIKNTEGRSQDTEKKLSLEVYKRVREFNWNEKILILGSNPGVRFPLWRGIDQACAEFKRRGGDVRHMAVESVQNDETLCELIEWRPEITLVVCTNPTRIINSSYNIRKLPGHKGLWHNDLRPVKTEYDALNGIFSALFLCWRESSGEYNIEAWEDKFGCPAYYMPQGSVINSYLRQPDEKYRALFIGGTGNDKYHAGRREFFEQAHVEVINESARTQRLKIEEKSVSLYRSARYSFAHSPQVPGYNSLRLYNILAYGGCTFVQHFPGIEDLFKDGEHLFVYRNAAEANKKMKELDGNEKHRNEVAKNGWRLQQAKHTVLWRIMNMVQNLQHDQNFWGFL